MKIKTFIVSLCVLASGNYAAANEGVYLYKDPSQPVEVRIDDLLSRMTLREKVMQLNQYRLGINNNINNIEKEIRDISVDIGSLIYFKEGPSLRDQVQKKAVEQSRLGIPILFGFDIIHGYRTVYPIPLAQACSWNPELVEQACAMAAMETRSSGVDWTFSPMIDVARDPRWGRVSEGYGEDPYTNAVFGRVSVTGYQGDDISDRNNVAACLKHYIGYGASEAGRDYTYTEISRQTLWDTYMLPYEEGVKAGAPTLMSSFNDISGTPATANHYILTEVLKERWGHDGFVVSDWSAVEQLRAQGVAADEKEAAYKAFVAGTEMDMISGCYDRYLEELVNEGTVSQGQLDEAVRRVLRLKFRLGLFENPYTGDVPEQERILLPEYVRIAERLAEESMVLLKNESKTLPLDDISKVAVIGPMAKNKNHLLGSWKAHGKSEDVVSIYEGLERELEGKSKLLYAEGCDFDGDDRRGFEEALAQARQADIIIIALGEKARWSGENASRSTIALPEIQEDLVRELHSLGKPIVLVLSSGRPLELYRLEPLCDAIIEIWQPGIAGGTALAGILTGRVNPSGKLAITFPYSTGQIPIYYNRRQTSRPIYGHYQDIPITPMYEFGHGLSYSEFQYGDLVSSTTTVKRGEKLTVEVSVKNNGEMDGAETVHWFISDPVCTISRPMKELKYFEKKLIKSGETELFRFDIDLERDLSFIDGNGDRFLESGDYYIMVKDKQLKIQLTD